MGAKSMREMLANLPPGGLPPHIRAAASEEVREWMDGLPPERRVRAEAILYEWHERPPAERRRFLGNSPLRPPPWRAVQVAMAEMIP